MSATKKCAWCKAVKPARDFYTDRRRKSGLQAHCKECCKSREREKRKTWTSEKREAVRAQESARYQANRDRKISMQSAWYQANRDSCLERERARRLRVAYGMSMKEFWELYEVQDGRCMICGSLTHAFVTPVPKGFFRRTAVDHDSLTGEVRGLLCSYCNTAIGLFGHDVNRLASAIAYLLDHSAKPTDLPVCCVDPTHPTG